MKNAEKTKLKINLISKLFFKLLSAEKPELVRFPDGD